MNERSILETIRLCFEDVQIQIDAAKISVAKSFHSTALAELALAELNGAQMMLDDLRAAVRKANVAECASKAPSIRKFQTTSFPFFAISKEFGVPYAEVLGIAEAIESMPDRPLLAGSEMHMAVHQVVSCERSRRLMVGEGRDE